jgi:hypothetical protein
VADFFRNLFSYNVPTTITPRVQVQNYSSNNKQEDHILGFIVRSACQLFTTPDGRVVVYGGYSKVKLKKDTEKAG